MLLASCGYHVSGQANLVPDRVQSIYVPAFGNNTAKYQLTDRLPEALARELIARTRFRVARNAEEADAVLSGWVSNYGYYPVISDTRTGRNTIAQATVVLNVRLVDKEGKKLYERLGMSINQRYEIAEPYQVGATTQPNRNVYFDESEPALDRLSREVARSVVSAILENF